MANIVSNTHAYIDTWGADVVITDKPTKIISISLYTESEGGLVMFEDKNATPVAMVGGTVDSGATYTYVQHYTPSKPISVNGLTMDDGGSVAAAGDLVIVHIEHTQID